MEDNKRKLYDALSAEYDLGTFEQFSTDIQDADKRKKLYDATINDYDFGDYDSFSSQLGFSPAQESPTPQVNNEPYEFGKPVYSQAPNHVEGDIYKHGDSYTRTEIPYRTVEYPTLGEAQEAEKAEQREDALAAYRSAYNRLEAPGEVDEKTLIEWGNNMENAPIEQKNLYTRIMGQDATNRVDLDAVMRSYDETKKSLEGVEDSEGLAAYLIMPAEQRVKLPEAERRQYEEILEAKRRDEAVEGVNELHDRISSLMEKQRISDVRMHRDYRENRSTGQAIKDAILAASVADTPQLQGIVPSSGLEATPEGKQSNEQNATLTAAGRKWNEMKYIINAAKDGNIFDGLDKALGSVDTWTSDQMLRDNMAIMRVANKFDEEGEKSLTENEKALLDALALNVAVSEMYGDEISAWYKGGEMIGEMTPFMIEMMMNPLSGLGKKAADKVTRRAIEKYGKKLVKDNAKKFALARGAAKIGAGVAGATGMALTTGLPAVGADIQKRMLGDATYGYDNEGNIEYTGHVGGEDLGTSAYKAVTSRMLDNVSEMLGAEYANLPLKWLQKAGKGTKLLGWIDNLANSKFGKGVSRFAEKTKWNGPIEEFLEEVHVGLLNPVVVGDQSWEEFFTKDNLATIAIGVAVPGAAISTANTIAGAADGAFKVGAQERWKMKNAEAMGYQLWQDNPNEWNDLTRTLQVGQMEDIEKTLKEVYNNPNLTPEQKKTALEYGVYSLQWRTAKGVEEAFNEGKKFIDPMLRDVYGTAYAERVSPVQANNAYKAMAEAEKNAQRVLGIGDRSVDEWLNGRTAEEAAMSSKEKLAAIKAYQTAKLDFEGRRDRYIAEKERAYMESDRSIQPNDNNGMVYATQLKDEPVYITGGNVALNEDGTIDVNNSSETLYVKFPDGHVEMTSPDKFTEVFTSDRTADLKAAKRAEIDAKWKAEFDAAEVQSVEQEKRDSGVVFDMTDAQGEHRIEILNEGEKMSDILFDGEETEISTEELNRWKQEAGIQAESAVADNATDNGTPTESEANVAPTGYNVIPVAPVENNELAPVELPDVPDFFRLGGKNYSVASRNADGSVDVTVDGKRETLPAGTDYSSLMPTDKKGDVIFTAMPVERTHEYFVQKVTNDKARALMIEKNRKKAEAERKKFDKDPDVGLDPDKWEEDNRKWEEGKKAAQAKVDYWNEVAKRDAEITRSETREAVENIKPDVVEETADEFIANQLAGIKITPESFKNETGLSNAEQAQLVGVISNDGVSVERAAEIITENYDSELKALGFTGDMQDVRDIIIDVLSQGNPRSYARKGREVREAENVDQQRAEAEAWARGAFDMTLEELYLYEETLLPRMMRDYEGFDENEYYSNLAENNGYDTTRESESIGRSGELLQGEQSVPAGGTPVVGQRNEGGAVSDDVQGGGQDGVAQEEVPVNEPVGNSEQLSSSEIPNNQSVAEGSAPGQSGVVDNNSANALQNGNNELNLQKENESDNESNQNDIPIGGQVSQPVPQGEHGTQTSQVSGAQEVAARLRERIESAQGDSKSGLREVENRVTREFAQENGLWIENETELGTPFPSGDEHNNYIDAENQVVYKVNNRMHTPSILDLLDRIEQHNKYFPDSKYSLVGFTSVSKNGDVLPVFAQDFVSDARMATVDEIDSYMGTLGFTRVGDGRYSNGEVVIKDLKPRNVLADADGDIYVVDAEFEQENSVKSGETAENGGEIQEPRSVEENLDNGDKKITSYNSRGEVATVVIERDGKVVSVDSYDEGVLFEHTEYDGNGKATSVTRYDKQGNVVGTQVYEDGKTKTPMQKLADQVLDRTEEKRRIPLRERARELEAQVGVKANVIESLDEVKNREARERIAAGEAVAGWYSGGQVYLYMPNIKDKREIELTYVHEVVAHHGVKKLLGERFNEFLDGVWKMMSEADRARMLAYVGVKENPTLRDMRAAADEYVAELAEKMNLGELEQSTWDKIVDWFKELLENIGFENLTKEDIESMLKASYSNLRAESGKGKTGSTENDFRARMRIQENAESKKIFETAKEIFGTTYDMREAGYILPDGTMLDFSGKHQVRGVDNSFLNGGRTVDHREIEDIAYDFDENPTGVSTDMGDFLDRGAIRIDYNVGAINLNTAPTAKQKALLKRLIERNDGDVTIDFGKGWDTEHYAEYESARASRVLGDIDRYYSEGIKPGGNTMFRIAEVQAIEEADKVFNEELDAFKEKSHKGLLHLGSPMRILLSAGVNAEELTLSPTVLFKHLKKQGLTTDDLKGLAKAIQTPILVYEHGENYPNIVVVTELDVKGGKLSIALELDDAGNVVEVSNVSSVHSKDAVKELERLSVLDEETLNRNLRWVEKEKVSEWLGLPYEEERQDANPKLISVANVINNFENPTIESENSSKNPQDAESGIRFRKKDSERRQEKRRINDAIDTAAGFITVGGKKQATKNRLKKEAERKQLAKEMYSSVLKGDFNDVTLSQIDKFIEDATPANPFGRRISQRLPQRMERVLRQGARTNAVDALFSRICESTVPANERFSEAGRREIEERKKELLKGWAIATGNWHTDLKEFTDDTEPIGEGKDSKVYMSKDGNSVIKASKGKPFGKKFRPDIDNIPLFNDVFKNSRYEILGYGEIDGQFVRILKQDFIDFAESTPLTPEERKEYMGKLGFKPLNKDYTAFSNGEIVIADLQKSNIVKDAAGNISVIDADAKLHTKDVGGDYTYPPVEEDLPEDSGTRFRIANENQDVFVSNAQRAVEGIQQNKATAEQWIAMLKKNGGLKAGEDAWLGLEEWLNEKQGAVTKQEILDYIGENRILIEEVKYGESVEGISEETVSESEEFGNLASSLIEYDEEDYPYVDRERFEQLRNEDEDFLDGFSIDYWGEGIEVNDPEAAARYLGLTEGSRPINSTRLEYTTDGLENKREIVLVVPTVESWNASDEIHFGDAGNGRAVAWVRFGETTVYETVEDVQEVTELHEPYRGVNGHDIYKPVGSFRSGDYIVHGKAKTGEMIYVVYINDKQIPIAHATLEEARNAMNEYYREHPRKLRKPVRVLVIDEIQSKRHQEGREKGYRSNADKFLKDNGVEIVETDTYFEFYKNGEVDKRFAKGLFNTDIEKAKNLYVAGYEKTAIPSAPFEKNWHELAIKRMLRLAAEEGFDKVAWTTGEQQAERYSLGTYINSIERFDVDDRGKRFELNGPARIGMTVGDDGVVIASSQGEYEGKPLSDVVGKELAEKMLAMENRAKLEDLDLKVGGEGMKGFYDRMLPSFVQKYTKKWGAKVGEVTMPSLEENNTMWSVDVTPEMQESVMQGQTMFRTVEETTEGSIDDIQTQPLTLMERITNSLLEVSAKNKENLELRASALRTFGRDINRVLSLMKAQREYDKSTVDTLVKLAKMYFQNAQLLGEVTPYEVARIMGVLNRSVGKRDISTEAAKLMDILLDAHANALAGILDKAEKIKAKKVNAAGVEVMGRLDKYGQKRVDEYRAAKGMTPEKLEEAIYDSDNRLAELEQRVREVLGIPDGDVDLAAREYTGDNDVVNVYMDERARLEGLTLAREYKESIQQVQEEIKDLKRELKQAEEDYRLGNIDGKSLKEFRKSVAEAIMESKAELIEGYHSLIYKFQENTKESSQRAKEFAQAQIDRAREIQHNANSDMEGIPADTQGTHPDNHNNAVMNALRSPFPTFQGMLKKFGEKNVEGKGYLYERFMPQATQASDNEFRGKVAARVMIETKLKEIYGEKANIAGFMKELREYGATVTYREGNEMKQFDLTKGQMLYIYMVNKMADGQMKLRRMGITDDVVAELMTKLPEEAVQFADWAQNELLKDLRGKYNAVHERVFGAPMAAIENYFPIKIRKEARGEKGDVSEVGQEGKPSTVTGSIIKRTKNATAIDLSADAMQVLMEHIDDMEHWAAFAEFNRDLNVLLNYKHFQNQVKNMTSVRYGSGEEMWKNFKKTAQIVSGTYRPSDSSIDRAVQNIAKGLTRSKINFRLYTAIKQLLSAPAFWTDAGVEELAYCYANPKGSFKWALENLPGFAERWQGRTMGNEKLLKSDSDWELWRNEFVEKATRWGMTPNAAIDALTVAQGARAVYMTKLEQFKKAGYTEQRANEKALQAAAEAYNESQQSSEGIYLSPLQVEGTVASAIFSTFKNSNFGYTRKTAQAVANIKRKMRKGYKEETIAFMTKQMIRDGLSEENAKRMAEKVYNRSKYKDVANVAMFGFGLNLLWEAGGMAIYLLLGDDDEEKEKMMKEIALRGSLGLLNGVPFGETMISAAMAVKEGDTKYFRLPELVAVSDIKNLAQVLNYDPVRGANDIVNMLVSMGVGVTPQVLTDILVAFGDVEEFSAEELGMFVARFMNAPQSNLDRLMVDDAMEDSAINADEIMRRYAEYKKSKNAPITQFLYPDAIEQKALERYMKRFNKMLDERLENVVEDNDAYDLFYKGADARMKSELAKMRQNYLAEDKAEAFEKMDAKELVERVLYGSGEINEAYFNLSTAEDEDDAFVLKSVLKELNDLVEEGMQTDEEEQLLKDLKRKDNIINKAKRLMKQQPDKAQEHMNNIRKKRAEAIKQINNYRKDE